MRKLLTLFESLFLVLAICAPTLAAGSGPGGSEGVGGSPPSQVIRRGAEYVPDELLVKFKGGSGTGAAGAVLRRLGAISSERLPYTDFDLLKVRSGALEDTIRALRSSGLVEYAEPNYIRRASWEPTTDPVYSSGNQWNIRLDHTGGGIDMPNAWSIVGVAFPDYGGSPSAVVAILDSGVAYRSGGGFVQAPDLNTTRFVNGYDFINNDPFPDDDYGHGTHVCGTVAQSTNNGIACAGIAFNCSVMPVKVLDRQGAGDDAGIIQGIRFATDSGAGVINMSLSGPDPNEALGDACDYAFGKGVVVCASSGNNNTSFVDYPAAYDSCIAVGATKQNMHKANYSNYGSALDVMAPGGDPAHPIYQQTYNTMGNPASGFGVIGMDGTSMACPHVAAVSALVKSRHPTWAAGEIRGTVSLSCHDLGSPGWDPQFGWGLIDAYAAVTMGKPGITGPVLIDASPDHAASGSTAGIVATGTDFFDPIKLTLERVSEHGIGGTNLTQSGSTQITCQLDLTGAQAGLWDVVVEDKAMRSDRVQGGYMVDSANNRTWYLAEGSTNYGFEEFVLIQNPTGSTANVELTFMTPTGARSPYPVAVAPSSRTTVRVNDVAPGTDVSTKVTSDQDIICERSMYWNNRIEGTDCIGVQAPSYTWHLSEGTTNYGFDTFVLIQNPNARAALVDVTYLTSKGPVEKSTLTVDGNSRYTVNVADDLPAEEMSFKVVADERVIVERSMYWDGRRGGHDSIGTNSPAEEWYLAEGSTDWGYEEYVLLGNPGAEAASVVLTYMTPSGPVPQAPVSVAAGSRKTIYVNAALPSKDVSVRVRADRGIIAERAMYWNNGTGKAGHCAIGVPQPRQECFLAEGSTNWGFDEWVLVQNPNDTACNVGIDYMTTSGLVPRNAFSLAANSRVTIHVNAEVPGRDTSTRVYSNMPIIAERAMYWNNDGGGHVSPGLQK